MYPFAVKHFSRFYFFHAGAKIKFFKNNLEIFKMCF